MNKKATSKQIASIAGKYVGDETPFDNQVRDGIAHAIRVAGIPLNDRALVALNVNIEAALSPMIADLRSLAGSCLGQREPNADEAGATGDAPAS